MSALDDHTDRLWPFRPKPIANESFSSWFCRAAWANGLSASELYPIALPGAHIYRIDLDRFACDALIENLAAHTGIPPGDLWPRTFQAWTGRLFEYDDGQIKLIWLPPAGLHRSSKSFGQQACPQCLREAETPHLKTDWRLGFVTSCDVHRTLLIDRCPACAAPIQPLYIPHSVESVAVCWNCQYDLRNVVTPKADNISAQGMLMQVLHDGWGELGVYGLVHALSYFRILWTVYRLLATGRFALPLRQWIGGPEPPSGIPRIKEIERLNPRCRHALIAMAEDLMRAWPHRFLQACRDVGLSPRFLIKDAERTPFALWEPVSLQLSAPVGEATPADIRAAKAYLRLHGQRPTYQALQGLLGMHFHAHRNLALPVGKHAPYGSHRYWKLDGVSPEVRAAAKRAAHQDGENVGPWVDKKLRNILSHLGQKL